MGRERLGLEHLIHDHEAVTTVAKACAYITRATDELLVFEGPSHDGFQIPKGTIEPTETPREAVVREIAEESGLTDLQTVDPLTTDVWTRSLSPPKQYRRHFFHVTVTEPRDQWTHTVTGAGEEHGHEFDYRWLELPPEREFALALDDYVQFLSE